MGNSSLYRYNNTKNTANYHLLLLLAITRFSTAFINTYTSIIITTVNRKLEVNVHMIACWVRKDEKNSKSLKIDNWIVAFHGKAELDQFAEEAAKEAVAVLFFLAGVLLFLFLFLLLSQ